MSDRILLVRVMGLGSLLTNAQLVLTSRGSLPYLDPAATLQGVVADLGEQFSSEIGFFESMGSDPTTSFSVISTAETREALLGRRKVPVADANGAPVVTTTYVPALFQNVSIGVSDTSGMFVGQRIRIGTIAWEVTNVVGSTEIRADRIWGSPRTPIPMILAGEEAVGMVVYDLLLSTGSVEGLPIVVSTAEVTATSRAEEEVIFRGVISKVGVDTSARAANQISVQCGSLMGYLRNAPFTPIVGTKGTLTTQSRYLEPETVVLETNNSLLTPTQLELTVHAGVYGIPTPGISGNNYETSMRAFQVRDGGRGGAFPPSTDAFRPWLEEVTGQQWRLNYEMPVDLGGGDVASTAFLWIFDGGFFTSKGESPITDTMANFYERTFHWSRGDVTAIVESAFVCGGAVTPATMLSDLLFGTVDGLLDGSKGWRGATEAAWLPYSEGETPSDVLDLASLEALLQGRDDIFPAANPKSYLRPLPYDANGAKKVADVLSLILKRLGGFVIYDRGRIRFGSWAVNNPIPTVVTDAALAEPTISMDFDRTACLQAVEVELGTYRWRYDQSSESNRTLKRPVTNLDLGAAGIGKTTQMGNFVSIPDGAYPVERFLMECSAFATATQAIVRYSQPAARVMVTYRNAVVDLTVGETVAFSTAFLPSATGEMGVELAVGIVLKAARSWKTPTTGYTLLLFGYTQATSSRVPLISVAARCVGGVVGGNAVPVEPVWFTRGTSATGGAPTSDVAAFGQVAILAGTPNLAVVLLDANGTEVGGGPDLAEPDVANSRLKFAGAPFLGTTILPGYVITLAEAGALGVQGWDAYQASAAGEVLGDPALSSLWVQ